MNEQRKAFEAYAATRWEDTTTFKRDDFGYMHVGINNDWKAWQAAIASQAPRQALTQPDPEWPAGEQEAFRLGAASGPNAALVATSKDALAYLESVARKTTNNAVWERCDILCGELRKALAAVGVEP